MLNFFEGLWFWTRFMVEAPFVLLAELIQKIFHI